MVLLCRFVRHMLLDRLGVRFLALIIRIRLDGCKREGVLCCLRVLFLGVCSSGASPRMNGVDFFFYQIAESKLCSFVCPLRAPSSNYLSRASSGQAMDFQTILHFYRTISASTLELYTPILNNTLIQYHKKAQGISTSSSVQRDTREVHHLTGQGSYSKNTLHFYNTICVYTIIIRYLYSRPKQQAHMKR
jgi:hypothetical protein